MYQRPDSVFFYRENQVTATQGQPPQGKSSGGGPVHIVGGAAGRLRRGVCTCDAQGLHLALLSRITPWFLSCQIRVSVGSVPEGARRGEEEDGWALGSTAWRHAGQDARWGPWGLSQPDLPPSSAQARVFGLACWEFKSCVYRSILRNQFS